VPVVTNARATYSTRAAAGASGARHSLCPLFCRGRKFLHNSGAPRREITGLYLAVIARSGAAKQSTPSMTAHLSSSSAKADDPVFRDINDRPEKPRRTGSPACAGDDSLLWSSAVPHRSVSRSPCHRARPRPSHWLALTAEILARQYRAGTYSSGGMGPRW
jgi:hypothetical protein